MTKLFIMSASGQGQSIESEGDAIYIGRSRDNDVRIKDRFVSRRHLKILKRGDRYFLMDLGSRNGTFIHANRIKPGIEFKIEEGIPIVLGMGVLCIGEGCSDYIQAFLDATKLSLEITDSDWVAIKRRPKTLHKNMELICNISDLLTQSSDIDEVLEKILDYILDVFIRIDRGIIILLDDETGEISKIISRSRGPVEESTVMYSRTVVDQVIHDGIPIIITDTKDEEEADLSDTLKLLRIESVMCVPLINRSRVKGVIYVDSTREPFGFRKDDLSIFTALGGTMAVAIDSALFYSAENGEGGY